MLYACIMALAYRCGGVVVMISNACSPSARISPHHPIRVDRRRRPYGRRRAARRCTGSGCLHVCLCLQCVCFVPCSPFCSFWLPALAGCERVVRAGEGWVRASQSGRPPASPQAVPWHSQGLTAFVDGCSSKQHACIWEKRSRAVLCCRAQRIQGGHRPPPF